MPLRENSVATNAGANGGAKTVSPTAAPFAPVVIRSFPIMARRSESIVPTIAL